MNQRSVRTCFTIVSVVVLLALLASTVPPPRAVAAPPTAAQAATANRNTATLNTASMTTATPTNACSLYPIALHTSSIAGKQPGDPIGDIYNGSSPGNFGWLSWTGTPSEPTLVTSLTPPGDSTTYVNPNNSADHVLLPGDWVFGKPGVSNSGDVQNALNSLLNSGITVPVWDQTQGKGSKNQYHVVGFAEVIITAYQLPGANRISAIYEGSTDCQSAPPPPPPPPPSPLSGATLTLSPSVAGPDVTGTLQTFTATLKNHAGSALSGFTVMLNVTGANTATSGGMTDANGQTTLTYQGTVSGTDSVHASVTSGSTTVQSNTVSVSWVTPAQTISTSAVWGRFFTVSDPNSGAFSTPPTQAPSFSQAFPTINFNPPAGTVPGNTSGVTNNSRPMVDLTTDLNGTYTGSIVAQGYDAQGQLHQAGTGDLVNFDAVFTGTYVVAAAGNVTFNIFTDDSFILSVGNKATRVNGVLVNPPASGVSPFMGFPVMGAWNSPGGATGNQVTVAFPAAGTYPYELDYKECCGDGLAVTMAVVNSSGSSTGVPPTGSLTLSPNAVANQTAGGTQTFTVHAVDAAGNALATLPVNLFINGTNIQQVQATTDSTGTATFTYTGTYAGTDTVQAIAWIGGQATFSGQVSLTWTTPPTPPPTPQTQTPGWIGSPTPQSTVTGVVPITLASNKMLVSGTVAYWPAANPQAVTTLTTAASGSGGATLATLDTTTLPNGTYIIQLLGTDNIGNQLNSETLVTVAGENKPGRVTFSVTDLTVPVAGLPITIGRTYDSLNKGQSGDFGYGWSLSVGSPKLTVDPAHNVTLTLPTGRRATFAFTPQSSGGVFGYLLTPGYTPAPGVYGSLTSDGCALLAASGGQYYCFPGGQYAPTTYTYTDPHGRAYVMGADGSMKSITDLNGNTLTFTAAGITSSAGNAAVSFTRDGSGRITAVTDPTGNVYSYGYDTSGNLASVTLPGVGTPVGYTYDATHLLLTAKDPRGNTGATATYDANGRLASVTNALSDTTSYSYDVNTNTTTETAPDGGVTTTVYDTFGDITSQKDALGHTTTFEYNGNHNLLAQTDAMGHKTTYTYDTQGNRTSVTDPLGKTSSIAYNQFSGPSTLTDSLGNVEAVSYDVSFNLASVSDSLGVAGGFTSDSQGNPLTRVDGNGKAITFTYDAFGNVLSQADPLGDKVSHTYDTLGHRLSSTDARGNTTKYGYDAFGRLVTETDPFGHVTSYQYDSDGNEIAEIDAAGNRTTHTYDPGNRLIQTMYPDGTTTSATYDFRGNLLTETDQAGHVKQFIYDKAGELTSVTTAAGTPDAATTSYAYDASGHKVKETDPLGHATTYTYDADGHLTSVTDPLGHATTYTYDAMGQNITTTDANGHTTSYAYDARGHLITTTYPDGTTARATYDGAGDVLTKTDQAGNVTTYAYDDAKRLQSVTDALQQTTSYTYDAADNLGGVTDANHHTTSFVYDALNRQTKKVLPDSSFETFGYDLMGNQTAHGLTDGHTTTATYDVMNRPTKLTYFDGTSVSYTYTPTGQQATVVDGRGTTKYSYDNQDRVTQVTVPDGQSVTYTYDAAGNRTGMTTAAGLTAYAYDAANHLATVATPSAGTIAFTYDNGGDVTQRTLPNGITIRYGYDTLNRLISVNTSTGSTTLATYAYTLDPAGNRTKVTEADGTTVNWTYDNAYRLTGETQSASGGGVEAQASYTYDGVGNRLSKASNGLTTNYSYNTLDQLTTATTASQITTYTYDGRGNLTGATVSGGSGASITTSYRWDAADRMVGATLPDGSTASYTYDANGRQVSQTTAAGATNYLWDQLSAYGDIVLETDGSSGAVQASYTVGNSDVLVETRAGTVSYALPDGQGSVRALANSSSAVTDTYRYDAYGNLQSHSGSTTTPYGYDGQRQDALTGLYQLRARNYDPGSGRFLSRDPLWQPFLPAELDRYEYAHASPIDLMDPTGQTAGAAAAPAARPFGGGGAFLEYAALLWQDVIWSIKVAAVGAALACTDERELSIIFAAFNGGAFLLLMKQYDPGEPPLCIIPVLVYPQVSTRGKNTMAIWQHIYDAQRGKGSVPLVEPMLLVRLADQVQADANRTAACAPSRFTPLPPPDTSCDEYPFASTYTSTWFGAQNISVRAVPPDQQLVQGGIIRRFYLKNHVLDGDPYACVPLQGVQP